MTNKMHSKQVNKNVIKKHAPIETTGALVSPSKDFQALGAWPRKCFDQVIIAGIDMHLGYPIGMIGFGPGGHILDFSWVVVTDITSNHLHELAIEKTPVGLLGKTNIFEEGVKDSWVTFDDVDLEYLAQATRSICNALL